MKRHEGIQRGEKRIRSSAGISVHRIELSDGQLPDMACGVNGVAQQTSFRPTHIDVEFDAKGVVETRIYGPQVKQDGSLSQRELDHRWRRQ
jgi:exodeoxyribonuclease-3